MKLLASLDRRIESLKVELRLANCGLSSARHIPTFTTKMELHHLHHLAQCTPENARVLEIGSYLGASTSYIIAGMRGERRELVCVDTWQNDTMPDGTKDTFAEFSKNLRPLHQ